MATALDSQIDRLYALPLHEFVTARQALAKTLSGEDAKRVKTLTKPTTLPWVVNQVRWHDGKAYAALLETGRALRAAQIAALEGRAARAQAAADAHKAALAAAVAAGTDHARRASVGVDPEALTRMLDTISLAESLAESHGRFTAVVQPAGFEALLGVAVQAPATRGLIPFPVTRGTTADTTRGGKPSKAEAAAQREAEQRAREAAEAAARRGAAIEKAKAAVAAAKAEETRAREAWRKAKDVLIEAEHVLEDLEER